MSTRPDAHASPTPRTSGERMRFSQAIEDVLSRFRDVALRAGSSHGMRGDDMDDVMQELRIRLWRAAGISGKLESLTPSYIYRAASSAALDLLRRRRARPEESMTDTDRVASETTRGTDSELLESETVSMVAAALEELVPSRRAVVRMHLAGYDREEIATLLQWSEAKTRNLLYRGLEDLRQALTARGDGPRGMR